MAIDKALERGERPSGRSGREWRIGIESLRVLKSKREELVDNTIILCVSSLKAPTSSTTIFPPGCSNVILVPDDDIFIEVLLTWRFVNDIEVEVEGDSISRVPLDLGNNGEGAGEMTRGSIYMIFCYWREKTARAVYRLTKKIGAGKMKKANATNCFNLLLRQAGTERGDCYGGYGGAERH